MLVDNKFSIHEYILILDLCAFNLVKPKCIEYLKKLRRIEKIKAKKAEKRKKVEVHIQTDSEIAEAKRMADMLIEEEEAEKKTSSTRKRKKKSKKK